MIEDRYLDYRLLKELWLHPVPPRTEAQERVSYRIFRRRPHVIDRPGMPRSGPVRIALVRNNRVESFTALICCRALAEYKFNYLPPMNSPGKPFVLTRYVKWTRVTGREQVSGWSRYRLELHVPALNGYLQLREARRAINKTTNLVAPAYITVGPFADMLALAWIGERLGLWFAAPVLHEFQNSD